CQQYSVWPFSF
nr:immunoglobulin light chain junction region [Macaca mulatta]